MAKSRREGTESTFKKVGPLLDNMMRRIGENFEKRPDLLLAAWPQIIGERLAPMTQAISFEEGTLTVKVNNSTLYSLLSQHEKPKLLRSLREKFPAVTIRNIIFRMG